MSRAALERRLGIALAIRLLHGGASWAEIARRRNARREAAIMQRPAASCACCGDPVDAALGRDGAGRGPCCDAAPAGGRAAGRPA